MRKNNGEYEYVLGQEIGLTDIIESQEIDWYKLAATELDEELPFAWFYLVSDTERLNDKHHPVFGNYAEMVESISDRIVVKD